MKLDPSLLARIQFAFTFSFHIMFPTISIGLAFSRFAEMAGPAIGTMIALEVLTAFFLEAGFLGIMLFGLNRVGPKLHLFETCIVALGTLISVSWTLSANSWMQTPSGVAVHNGHRNLDGTRLRK